MKPAKNLKISYLAVDCREIRKLQHAVNEVPLHVIIPTDYIISELQDCGDISLSVLVADTEDTGISMLFDEHRIISPRRRTVRTLRQMIRATAAGARMISGLDGIDFKYRHHDRSRTIYLGFFDIYPVLHRHTYQTS